MSVDGITDIGIYAAASVIAGIIGYVSILVLVNMLKKAHFWHFSISHPSPSTPAQGVIKVRSVNTDYDRIADKWGAARRNLSERDEVLIDLFVQALPENPEVLDLGCGTGRPIAAKLVAGGACLIGVDRSTRLLAMAEENVPEATFLRGDLLELDVDGSYDGIVLWDVIFHLERKEHEPLLRRISSLLRPGGHVIITSGGSAHPPFMDVMFGHEFFYDAHGPEDFVTLCKELGFSVLERSVLDEPSGGRNKGRIGVLLGWPARPVGVRGA